MRVLCGAMNSATNPLTFSLVADYVRPERRATANSVLTASSYVGIAISSLSILMIKETGWRLSYMLMGLVGVVLGAITIIFIREPKRVAKQRFKELQQISPFTEKVGARKWAKGFLERFWSTLTVAIKEPTSRYVTIAAILRVLAGVSGSYFLPIYFMKVFPG
jgi:MFS family permease